MKELLVFLGDEPHARDITLEILAIARDRQAHGESITAVARHLEVGRSTLYRALQTTAEQPYRLSAGSGAIGPRGPGPRTASPRPA